MGAVLMSLPDTYGERLRLFRDEAGLTQEQLAERTGKATLSIGR
jgi:transcriptional regulator with XRE-family HTH domain